MFFSKKNTTSMPEGWENLNAAERQEIYEPTASIFPIVAFIADFLSFYESIKNNNSIPDNMGIGFYVVWKQGKKGNANKDIFDKKYETGLLSPTSIFQLLFICPEIMGYMRKNHASHVKNILTYILGDIYQSEINGMDIESFKKLVNLLVIPPLNIDIVDVLLELSAEKCIQQEYGEIYQPNHQEIHQRKMKYLKHICMHLSESLLGKKLDTKFNLDFLSSLYYYEFLLDEEEIKDDEFKNEMEKMFGIFLQESIPSMYISKRLLIAHQAQGTNFKLTNSQLKLCKNSLVNQNKLLDDILNIAPKYNKNLENKLEKIYIHEIRYTQ